ncbi:two-component system, chemotaxis family, sensor kinase CheA [Sphingomonas sp. YR710]|uniref:chemotaxis protein CheA n=1 Tax=Sphingomonas sp. YR710 TaxID=1882773 RepID=UPI0008877CDD|nr:chemotaxis protein CheA [Sphingomonas sp. YR710]SDC32997.1 two-component system, chemotaxis family, sensor kinase CheA [Sphingomonas sp. YR710]
MKLEEIQDIFFQECDEGLVQAESGLLALQSGQHDDETINTIFRSVHSIKGGSGAFGFTLLQHFTHHFETLLDQVRGGEHKLTPELVGVLLAAFDILADHVGAIRGEKPAPDDAEMLQKLQDVAAGKPIGEDVAAVVETAGAEVQDSADSALGFDLADLMGALDDGTSPGADWEETDASAEGMPEITALFMRPTRGAMAHGGEPLLLLRELIDLGGKVRDVDWTAVPTIDRFDPEEAYLSWHIEMPGNVERGTIEEIFEFVSDDCTLSFGAPAAVDPIRDQAENQDSHESEAAVAAPIENVIVPLPVATAAPAPTVSPAPVVAPPPPVVDAAALPTPAANDPDKTGAAGTPVGVTQTIRVDLEKLDRLVNLVGELVITQAMLAQRLLNCGLAQITELTDLDHLTRELQDSAMSIRAQPIRSVFSRVPRMVRELQASTGKRVHLEVDGEATELDKTVVERIGEPLTHLIRNAIDHGLEGPEERIAAGKNPEGRVRLSAEHRSGRILICVSDDGRGINREKVLAKAVDRGLVAPDAKLSDEEIENLIFAPGFSTAATISNISGRGVGLDVVRRNVQSLGGRITISSKLGQGSTFTLALPLTLAILDGMIVSVGEQTYVIPLTHIIESLRPKPGEVKQMGANQPMLNVRGTWLPIQSVARELDIPGGETDPTKAVLIVVDSEAAGQAVLMVDAIRDQRQVVIKSLETNYRQVDGVAGATILGDGRVALILDVEAVTAARRAHGERSAGRGWQVAMSA